LIHGKGIATLSKAAANETAPSPAGVRAVIVRLPFPTASAAALRPLAELATVRLGVVPRCEPIFDRHFVAVEEEEGASHTDATERLKCRAAQHLFDFVAAMTGVNVDVLMSDAAQSVVHLNNPDARTSERELCDGDEPRWSRPVGSDLTIEFPVRRMFSLRRFVTDALLSAFNAAVVQHMLREGKEGRPCKLIGKLPRRDASVRRVLDALGALQPHRCIGGTPVLMELINRRAMHGKEVLDTAAPPPRFLARFSPPLRSYPSLHNQLELVATLTRDEGERAHLTELADCLRRGLRTTDDRDSKKENLFELLLRDARRPMVGVVLSDTLTVALSRSRIECIDRPEDATAVVFQVGDVPSPL
jgi:hypothetical protein